MTETTTKKLENVKASAEIKQYTIDEENACIVNIATQLIRGIQCELEADTDDAVKAWHLVSTIEEAARRVAQANETAERNRMELKTMLDLINYLSDEQ